MSQSEHLVCTEADTTDPGTAAPPTVSPGPACPHRFSTTSVTRSWVMPGQTLPRPRGGRRPRTVPAGVLASIRRQSGVPELGGTLPPPTTRLYRPSQRLPAPERLVPFNLSMSAPAPAGARRPAIAAPRPNGFRRTSRKSTRCPYALARLIGKP